MRYYSFIPSTKRRRNIPFSASRFINDISSAFRHATHRLFQIKQVVIVIPDLVHSLKLQTAGTLQNSVKVFDI